MIPKNLKILHLEDMSSIRDLLKNELKQFGISEPPLEAANVAEAFNLLDKHLKGEIKIDFIISDWNLPDDTGLTFLKKVREYEVFNEVPFIMATTESEVTFMLDAINFGCTNYLTKPWQQNELKEKIENSLDSKYIPSSTNKQITKNEVPSSLTTSIKKEVPKEIPKDNAKEISKPADGNVLKNTTSPIKQSTSSFNNPVKKVVRKNTGIIQNTNLNTSGNSKSTKVTEEKGLLTTIMSWFKK